VTCPGDGVYDLDMKEICKHMKCTFLNYCKHSAKGSRLLHGDSRVRAPRLAVTH
jgi:hypothetical protein